MPVYDVSLDETKYFITDIKVTPKIYDSCKIMFSHNNKCSMDYVIELFKTYIIKLNLEKLENGDLLNMIPTHYEFIYDCLDEEFGLEEEFELEKTKD